MGQIVPGLFLGDIEASYKQNMLERMYQNIYFLTNARWVSQSIVTSRYSAKTQQLKTSLLT
ncbi:dual specificity phosphatase Yvh1 [Penicillium frequentans]|nr:dual specificity phosphatase Yvh1 [Penicillium glabrum]